MPPMVQLRVVEEDAAVRGRDFFEEDASEELATTAAVIARVFRGRTHPLAWCSAPPRATTATTAR